MRAHWNTSADESEFRFACFPAFPLSHNLEQHVTFEGKRRKEKIEKNTGCNEN